MARIAKRRGVWVLDYRDVDGIRRTPSFETYEDAEAAEKALVPSRRDRRQRRTTGVEPGMTFAVWAPLWLAQNKPPILKPRAYDAYADAITRHHLPALGPLRLVEIRRGTVRALLHRCQTTGRHDGGALAPGSVRLIMSALRVCLQAAVDDEILAANPAARLGGKRGLRLEPTSRARREAIEQRVLTRTEVDQLLAHIQRPGTAARRDRIWYPLVLTYLRAGLRLGEALALEVTDFSPDGAGSLNIRQAQNKTTGALARPKHGRRIVDLKLSPELVDVLRRRVAGLKKDALKRGRPLGRWLFPTTGGTRIGSRNAARALARLAVAAGIGHRSARDLRHTYATLLIEAGAPIVYVQKQLGHASVQLTIDTYASGARPALPDALVGVFDSPATPAATSVRGS